VNSTPDVPPYQGLAAHYDELLGEQSFRKMRDTFEWLVQRYGLRFRSAVDVGCGTGTFVEYLLRAGVDPVWGVDRSPEMLSQAVTKNGENRARFLLQDLRELRLPESVDLLTCQFETLNYLLTDTDLRTAFAGFAHALTPGGFAVFDVASRRPGQPGARRRIEFSRFANHTVTIHARYDTERLLQVARVRVAASAATQSERHVQRLHTIDDVAAALQGSGLEIRATHDCADVQRPAQLADSVIFLARRTHLAGQPSP
jgi:SAM-dependent methyltransferase